MLFHNSLRERGQEGGGGGGMGGGWRLCLDLLRECTGTISFYALFDIRDI